MLRRILGALRRAGLGFLQDGAFTLAAALSFYTVLSLAPVLMIVLAVAGFLWGREQAVQREILGQIEAVVGSAGADTVETVMREAGREDAQGVAAVIGIATLVFASTAVFAQLQGALNVIWRVKPMAFKKTVLLWLRKRLLSLGMVVAIAFLLLVSLVVSAAISYVLENTALRLPQSGLLWRIGSIAVFLVTHWGLFSVMYKVLPDARIPWKVAATGGAVTAILFACGKEAIGLYLGQRAISSTYGAAGSLVVLLFWVYYSALIIFFGAEFTRGWMEERGQRVEAEPVALSQVPG